MGRVATTQFLFDRREVSRRRLMGPRYCALGLPRQVDKNICVWEETSNHKLKDIEEHAFMASQ